MPHRFSTERTEVVYNYWVSDGGSTGQSVSTSKASLATIREQLHSEPLMGTAETVAVALLDEQGHYRRTASGWAAVSDHIAA